MTDPQDRARQAIERQERERAADAAFREKEAAGELTVDDMRARLHPKPRKKD